MTENIPEIIDEPVKAGCAPGNETIGYLAGEISRLRGLLKADNEAREKMTSTLMEINHMTISSPMGFSGQNLAEFVKAQGDLLEFGWTVIANAGPTLGNWDGSDPEWVKVACKWRDQYFSKRDFCA